MLIVVYRLFDVPVIQDTKVGQGNEDKSESQHHIPLERNLSSMVDDVLNRDGRGQENESTPKKISDIVRQTEPICQKSVKDLSTNLGSRRYKKKQDRKKFECSTCQINFNRHGDLKRHMVKHSNIRPYKCLVCEKTFKRLSELNSHMQIHSGVKYTCETCNFTTMNKISLRTHNRRIHQRDLRYHCEHCNKGFMSNYDLQDHVVSHLGTKTFICEYCGKAYSQKSYLVAHKRMIHGIQKSAPKKYQCDICNKSFASEYNLRSHAALHTHSFLCAQCGQEFATNHALKLHNRKHTGERPYQCKLCAKAFARSAALRVHKLTHTGERPYVCDLCGQNFTQRSSMMAHRRKHPGFHPPPPPFLLSRFDVQKSN